MTHNFDKDILLTPAQFREDLLISSTVDRRAEAGYRSGELIRIARGWYTLRGAWNQAHAWERIPVLCAALQLANPDVCFSGATGCQLLGLPSSTRPTLIHLDKPNGIHVGKLPQIVSAAPGHKLWQPPDRFAHHRSEPWNGIPVKADHFNVVPPDIAAIETALWESFILALQVMDALLRATAPFNISKEQLLATIDRWPVKAQARRARRILKLADARAESPMESLIRAVFILYGFEPPEIQTEFKDGQGHMYVDFYWPGLRLVIEYDGEGKWMDPELATGRAQWERIHKHNERHDRLMDHPDIDRVVHLTKEDLRSVPAFVRRMDSLGIPRDPTRALRFPNTPVVRV